MSALIDDRPLALAILNRIEQEGGEIADDALDEFLAAANGGRRATETWKAVINAGFVVRDQERWFLCDEAAQYVARGDWDAHTLEFLPHSIRNLHTRRAFLTAGGYLIDEFTMALRAGDGAGYVREWIVPPAFAAAVDADLMYRLYAAASALITRLMCDAPAGCVAEELIAVRLCALAESALDDFLDEGHISTDEHDEACGSVEDLWGFFQDDDVRLMFAMREPADASMAMQSEALRQMDIADQRLQAWFEPFWGLPTTGHLRSADTGDEQ